MTKKGSGKPKPPKFVPGLPQIGRLGAALRSANREVQKTRRGKKRGGKPD